MHHVEAGLRHRRQHRFRRRRRGHHEGDALGKVRCAPRRRALSSVDITMGAPHRWVTPCSASASIDRARPHPAQADMGARHHRQRPGKAPAIAVEHGQRPQQHGMARPYCPPAHCCSPSGPRRDDDRPRPWDCRWCPTCSSARWRPIRHRGIAQAKSGSPRCEEGLVILAQPRAALRKFRIVIVDHQRLASSAAPRLRATVAENSRSVIRIFAAAMLQHEGDGRRHPAGC